MAVETLEPLVHDALEVKYAIKSVTSKYYNLRCTDPRQTIDLVFNPAIKIYTLLVSDIGGQNPQTVPGFQIDPQDPESVTTGFWSNGHSRQSHSSAFFKRQPARYLKLDFASRYGACQFSAHLNMASNGRVRFLKIER